MLLAITLLCLGYTSVSRTCHANTRARVAVADVDVGATSCLRWPDDACRTLAASFVGLSGGTWPISRSKPNGWVCLLWYVVDNQTFENLHRT